MMSKNVMKLSAERCIGCGICERNCPVRAIRVENKKATVDESLCIGCGMCAAHCPKAALYLAGHAVYGEEAVLQRAKKKKEGYVLTVNGRQYAAAEDKSLLRFLRDDLRLYSVKDGCSEGACGTCTVVVDGEAVKACALTTRLAEGMSILTVEGLSLREKEAFVYAFGASGSVQCGFCIPGMVMAAKALIMKKPDPSEAEIREAIRNNICRCTGYKKVIGGIKKAAAILRGDEEIGDLEEGKNVRAGERAFRVDVRKKTLGYGKYPDDIGPEYFVHDGESIPSVNPDSESEMESRQFVRVSRDMPPMAFAAAVRSAYPRARVLHIHAERALALPGVLGVLTAADVPHNKVGHITQDWDVMIAEGDITRCVGDAICLVVAESPYILEKAKALVKIEYEELTPVRNISEAKAEGAPQLHRTAKGNICASRHVLRGDAKQALAESAHVITKTFRTPFTEHAFLEPECAVAYPYGDGVKVLSSDQGAYDTRHELLIMFGWEKEPDRVVVENQLIGGGFGGKEDVSVQHLAALAAYRFGRPVKCRLTRGESIRFHPKRHAMEGTFTLGCDEEGHFTGMTCEIFFDTGAYASLCGPVLERACTHSVGPYTYQNTDIRGTGYYTNNPPAGAFRGFGVCQSEFALESIINLLAEEVGISPWEIRFRNAIEPGKVLPNGQIADVSTALKETLLAVKPYYDAHPGRAGIACAMKNAGVGVGLPDKGRCRLEVEDGTVVIYAAASDIGQGCLTVFVQAVAETTGLPRRYIRNAIASTENAPDSGTTSGSRQTLLTGEAVRGASQLLAEAMRSLSDDPVEALRALSGRHFYNEYYEPTDPLGTNVKNPKSHIAYGYATNVVVLDDEGKVTDIYAAYDAGKVMNPLSIEGQIEGGVLMSLGYAFTEDFPLEDCVPTASFGTLGLFRATEIPDIHAICVEKEELLGVAYGAKGIGEITSIPAAPAAQGAYYAYDGVFRTQLPLEDTYYRPAETKD